ncbi:6989_t:CDS:2 [Funneliformis mosseae]|uniref:6989_t:CDS:1 n=1 Tax=Funneliformis mosseae TaxID=27381 RepID=A0A9N9H281_FUNMO|nr:6989_t:CDS:2 [Funneliformis mosseae]
MTAKAETSVKAKIGVKKKRKAINVRTTTSNTLSRSQLSRIPRPIVTLLSRTTSRTGTASRIPQAIPSPNRLQLITPSVPSSSLRSVTPSFFQSAKTINIFINYAEPDDQE